MRYVIIGAGAVGGTVGGLLAAAGSEVVLVARGAHLQAIRENGLRVATPAATRTVHVPTASGPDEVDLRPGDVLILAVKSQDTLAALAAWSDRPVTGGGTAAERLLVVCAQNGVENERAALRRFERVAGMCVWLPATFLEAGQVSAPGDPVVGVLTLGMVPRAEVPPELVALARDLEAAAFLAPVVDDVMAWKYAKLLSNLGNAVEALCGRLVPGDATEVLARAVAEARTVLAAAGVTVVSDDEQASMRAQFTLGTIPDQPRGGGSTWQSLVRGASTLEVDHLNGEIALLGRLHGVPTPVNATLQRLANGAASAGAQPGSWAAADLLTAVSAA
jgi:2-dehydropantoate 2-reductase